MQERPNILIIHNDEHRYDCLGAYGNEQVKTPNLDRLAENGVTYQNSYCTLPVCTPSRYSFLTGLYPHQHMGWTNQSNFPEAFKTFPGMLREAGYRTKAVGKMHFTPTYLDIGFDELELAEQNGHGRHDDDYHRYLREKGLVDYNDLLDQVSDFRNDAPEEYWESVGAMESNLAEEDHKTTWIADRAVAELKKWNDGNNLLMAGFINPHHPFDPPAPWSQMYDSEEISILPGWTEEALSQDTDYHLGFFKHEDLTEEQLKRATAYYYACISQIDYHIGRMIDLLKEKGIYDKTMIIFTSDHGDYMGYHHMLLKQNHMYEPLMKVPLIIKYPTDNLELGITPGLNQDKQQTLDERLVNNIDLAPTILEQVGLDIDENMPGIDLADQSATRNYLFAESIGQQEYMVRSKKYKLLLNKNEESSQFFDLEKDPYEIENLYNNSEYQDKVTQYKKQIYRWLLFEEPTPIYLNEKAKVIDQPNVPDQDDNHREKSEQYFSDKMNEEL